MGILITLLYPLVSFLNAYKWYLLIAGLIYLVLTLVFKRARAIITILFGLLMLFFLLTHLGGAYKTAKGVMSDMADTSTAVSEEYANYVSDNILPREDLTPAEKLERALTYGLTGSEDDASEELPASDDMGFLGTWKFMFGNDDKVFENQPQVTADDGTSNKDTKKTGGLLHTLYSELKELVGIHW